MRLSLWSLELAGIADSVQGVGVMMSLSNFRPRHCSSSRALHPEDSNCKAKLTSMLCAPALACHISRSVNHHLTCEQEGSGDSRKAVRLTKNRFVGLLRRGVSTNCLSKLQCFNGCPAPSCYPMTNADFPRRSTRRRRPCRNLSARIGPEQGLVTGNQLRVSETSGFRAL